MVRPKGRHDSKNLLHWCGFPPGLVAFNSGFYLSMAWAARLMFVPSHSLSWLGCVWPMGTLFLTLQRMAQSSAVHTKPASTFTVNTQRDTSAYRATEGAA
jgi:hypothetical protein